MAGQDVGAGPESKKIAKCLNYCQSKFKKPALTLSFIPDVKPIPVGAFFSMGDNTLKIPMVLFSENRRRLCEKLRSNSELPKGAIVLLRGGDSLNLYSTDVEYVFRQEPYFNWTFGVREPGFYGAIVVETGESILFIPRIPEDYATWMGAVKSPYDFKRRYETSEVNYVDQNVTEDDTVQKLVKLLAGVDTQFCLFANFTRIDDAGKNNTSLKQFLL